MVGGVTLGLFSLGMFVPWANAKGAITGAVTSLVTVLWIGLGAQVAAINGQIHLDNKPISIKGCPCINETTIILNQSECSSDNDISSIYKVRLLLLLCIYYDTELFCIYISFCDFNLRNI